MKQILNSCLPALLLAGWTGMPEASWGQSESHGGGPVSTIVARSSTEFLAESSEKQLLAAF